jgi:outer membrane biogenesis lipoprotein LolB
MNKIPGMMFRTALLMITAALIMSCSGSRKAIRAPLKEEGADYLTRKLKEHELHFDRFSAKFTATYQADRKKTTVSGVIRIERDSIIWLSITPALGLEAARFMLTPDSIKFINRIGKTYFLHEFGYINQLLNKTLDYDMAQSFLTGNDFSLYDSNTFKASVDNQQYKLSTVNRRKLKRHVRRSDDDINIPIQSIWLDPVSFKVSRVLLREAERDSRKFSAEYSNFEETDGNLVPANLDFKVETDSKKIRIQITYSHVEINQEQTYPFRIPDNYTEIQELQPVKE